MTDTEKTRLLAERVMGWAWSLAGWVPKREPGFDLREKVPNRDDDNPFTPLTSISDAFECLEMWRKADNRRWYTLISPGQSDPLFECGVTEWSKTDATGRGETLPRAICEALLRATGAEEA